MQSRRISVDDPAGSVANFSLNSIAELPEEEAKASGSYGADESGPVSLQDELRMCNEYIWVRRKSSMPLHERSKSVFARTASAAAATQTEGSPTATIKKAKTSMTMCEAAPNYKDIFREIFTVLARARDDSGAATTTAAAAAVGCGVT